MPLLELIVCIINPRDLIAPPLTTKCSLTFRQRGQDEELKDQDEKRIMNNVENGNIDVVKDTNSTKMGASLPE